MSLMRDDVNPLRPYHIPPTVGDVVDPDLLPDVRSSAGVDAAGTRTATKAHKVFADLHYDTYSEENQPSLLQSLRELIDESLWRYASILMSQPFEVAKTILQARDQGDISFPGRKTSRSSRRSAPKFESGCESQDTETYGDEPAYFTSNASAISINSPSDGPSFSRAVPLSPRAQERSRKPDAYSLSIHQPDSVLEVIGQLWQRDGTWGVWKGSNATFLYTILQSSLENWSQSFLSAVLNVPDLGFKEDIDRLIDIASPYPWMSLFVAGTAAITTGLLLAPIDLVRTRVILSPTAKSSRRTLTSLRALPSYLCPSAIALPTILNSLIHPLLSLSTPLALRAQLSTENQASPLTMSVAKFVASSIAILVKLPVETVLRRGQAMILSNPEYIRAFGGKDSRWQTVVPIGRYNGVYGTMRHIVSGEGKRAISSQRVAEKNISRTPSIQPKYRKGQGLGGLWRGWKVNWWGLVGLWTASVVGNVGEGEF